MVDRIVRCDRLVPVPVSSGLVSLWWSGWCPFWVTVAIAKVASFRTEKGPKQGEPQRTYTQQTTQKHICIIYQSACCFAIVLCLMQYSIVCGKVSFSQCRKGGQEQGDWFDCHSSQPPSENNNQIIQQETDEDRRGEEHKERDWAPRRCDIIGGTPLRQGWLESSALSSTPTEIMKHAIEVRHALNAVPIVRKSVILFRSILLFSRLSPFAG